MVKFYASLLALALIQVTSSALAYPLTGTDVRQRDLDQEEFLGREYGLLSVRDTYHNDDLEGRSIFSMFGSLGKAGKAIRVGRQAGKLAGKANKVNDAVNQFQPNNNSNKRTQFGSKLKDFMKSIRYRLLHHHRRDLEEDEELLQRDFEDEELLEREYDDDLLVERDTFDDLD